MIIIGPFIFIINNYGSAQEQPPEQSQPPPAPAQPPSLTERSRKTKGETDGMVYARCDTTGCEWDGYYDTPGKAGQGLGMHKDWEKRTGKLFKKLPFGKRS